MTGDVLAGGSRGGRAIVAFDLGGTLVSEAMPALHPVPAALAIRLGLGPERLERHLMTLTSLLVTEESREAERQRPARDVVAAYLAEQALSCSVGDVEEAAWHLVGGEGTSFLAPLPFARELLGELRAREVVTAALSNTSLTSGIVRRLLAHGGLLDHLDHVVLSSDYGWRKPSPRAFAQLEASCKFRPGHDVMVFVGNDVERDILPALARGYRAVLVGDRSAPVPTAAATVPVALGLMEVRALLSELISRPQPGPRPRS